VSSPEETIKLAESAYRTGDSKRARQLASQALDQTESDSDIGGRARKILRATGIDPLAIVVFAVTTCVLLFLILRYFL
jgi:hypothetical protein